MSDIFTDSRVTMEVVSIDQQLLLVTPPGEPVPTKTRLLLGIVQWVEREHNLACVYWETGMISEHRIDDLALATKPGVG